VIIVDHERGRSMADGPFAAAVGIVTFGPPQARYGVEEIAVQSACAERSLPSIVRAVLRGGTPTSVWWTEDLSQVPPIEPLVDAGRQFLYDSRRWRDVRRGVLAVGSLLERQRDIDLADINWRRLRPFRHALLHASDALDRGAIRHGHIRIAHRPGEAALAWLLVGWLAAQLDWSPETTPQIEETQHADELLSLAVGSAANLTVSMNAHRVVVRHAGGIPPFTTAVPHERDADAIAAELRNLSHDACLHAAIRALVAQMR
jgi:glucose-6-phosphate dehydrogenase assembly protein OpcA